MKRASRTAVRETVLSTCGQLGVDAAIMSAMKPATRQNTPVTDNPLCYADYRFPPDVISYAVWLYYRFPLSLRMVEELLAARGIELTYETVRRLVGEVWAGHRPAHPLYRVGPGRQAAPR
jgi:hypothetical protein